MKSKIIIVLNFLFSILSFGQTKTSSYENDIKKSLSLLFQGMKTKNINNAVECIYPHFFTVVSEEHM